MDGGERAEVSANFVQFAFILPLRSARRRLDSSEPRANSSGGRPDGTAAAAGGAGREEEGGKEADRSARLASAAASLVPRRLREPVAQGTHAPRAAAAPRAPPSPPIHVGQLAAAGFQIHENGAAGSHPSRRPEANLRRCSLCRKRAAPNGMRSDEFAGATNGRAAGLVFWCGADRGLEQVAPRRANRRGRDGASICCSRDIWPPLTPAPAASRRADAHFRPPSCGPKARAGRRLFAPDPFRPAWPPAARDLI